jgi:multidrug efflux pump subunit AcrB
MFTRFLHRPALAIVISLLVLFMGGLSIKMLPIAQFPEVAPPTVRVSVSYPGASAKILIDSTMVILEQAINGVPYMRYMMGDATSAGEGTITIVFEPGTDPQANVMQVNNRVQAVKNNLPDIVQREGIIVLQNMPSMLMYVNIFSKDPTVDQNFLYNFSTVNVQREVMRTPGVGQAQILGNRAYVRHARRARSRTHACLQGVFRRGHEGAGRSEHHRLARPPRASDRNHVADPRVRAHLGRSLHYARRIRRHHHPSECQW